MDCEASTRTLLESMLLDASIEPTNIPLSLLKAITNNFSDDQKIGSGGFAIVYKGLLQNGTIAVKKLWNIEVDEKKFTQEIDSLMRVKHKNVVRFLGYCADTQGKWSKLKSKNVMVEVRQRLLCFEFLPNGSLDQYISGASHGLEWKTRYQIIKGVCEGLHYLHKNNILHLDLKPGNILLNENMVPKIADLGLSRCFEEKQSRAITSKLIGTLGYMAPEFFSGVITFKLDIYSLGVIILEILTGEKGYAGVDNVLEGWKTRFKTPQGDTWLEQIRVCAKIGTQCMDSDPEKRPVTQRILETLDEIECIYGFTETDICASLVHKGSTELQKATHVVPPETSRGCEVGIRADSCSSYSITIRGTYHVVGKIKPAPAPAATPTAVGSFLKIRKYVLLLATLDASAAYLAALSPAGGLWLDNDSTHLAGDPVLQVTYPLRYMVFFCSNVTAFVASIIAVTLLLVQSLSRHRWWLRALQSAIIVDQFGLMEAYAAGSCRDMVMSAYVPLFAIMVPSYVLVFALRVLRIRDVGRSVVPQLPQTVDRARKDLLIFATLVVTVTYQVGLRTPGGFLLSDSQGDEHHLAGDPVLLAHNPSRFMEFFYFNSTAFMASLVIIMHLMSRTATRYGFQSYTLWVCTGAALIGLMGAVSASAGPLSIKIPIYVIALMAAIILYYVGLQVPVLLCKPVENYLVHSVEETMQKFLKLDQSDSQGQHVHAVSDPKTLIADQLLQMSRMCLLLLGIVAASVTYQVALNPPGGFWQTNATDGLPYYLAGDSVLHITYPWRYLVFFFCNTTAFVASLLVILILLLSNDIFSAQGIKYCALRVAMIMDFLGLIGAYAAGSCRSGSKSVYFSVLLVPVFLYAGIHILMFMFQDFPNHATWREMVKENLEKFVPKWLKKLFELQTEDEDADQKWKLEKTRKLLLLLGILAAGLTYQAGMNPPGGFWQENKTGHIVGNPVLSDNYQRRYLAFFYSNTTAFVASLAIIMLLVNRRLSATGMRSHALRVCVILDLFGLMSAFVAGSCRKVSTFIFFFVLVFAVLFCIALQVASKLVPHLPLTLLSLFGSLEEESSVILHHTATVGGPRHLWGEKFAKYLLLLASVTAAVTYKATMNPPGGLWDDGQTGHIAGDPVLLSSYPRHYKAFFYCNSTSFVASLVVMVLLLIKCVRKAKPAISTLQTAMILNLFGLMGAYAAGSCRTVLPLLTFWRW